MSGCPGDTYSENLIIIFFIVNILFEILLIIVVDLIDGSLEQLPHKLTAICLGFLWATTTA